MFDKEFLKRYGKERDDVAEQIADMAGTSDGDHSIFLAAAELILEERKTLRQLKRDISAAIGFAE